MSLLQTDEAVHAALVHDSPMAIAVSTLADGRILDVNDTFLRLFGYSRDEVIGETTTSLDLWADPAQRTELLSTLAARDVVRDYEVTVRTKTGDKRQVLATVTPGDFDGSPGLITQLYDVTSFRQTEIQFQTLVEQLPVITYVHGVDESRTLTYISPQVKTIAGYSPEEILSGQPELPDWASTPGGPGAPPQRG